MIPIQISNPYLDEPFKPNQKIICINNQELKFEYNGNWNDHAHRVLKLNKIYTVQSSITMHNRNVVKIYLSQQEYNLLPVLFPDPDVNWFLPERFISIKEYRKLKLNKLKNE